jgi:hypothetical protein
VRGEVGPVVAAGVELEFVGDAAGAENFVEGAGAGVEAEIVFAAAIEIDSQAGKRASARESERAVALPERGIWGIAEDAAEDTSSPGSGSAAVAGEEHRKFFDEGGAVGADGAEELWAAEGEMERAVAAHGDARDSAIGAAGPGTIVLLDVWEKFLEEEIFVALLAVAGIDVEAGAGCGSGDEEFADAIFFLEILDEVPAAGTEEHLFVVAEAVEEIEDGVAARFVGVEAGRKKNAVGDRAMEDSAGERIAFGARSSEGGWEVKEVEEVEEVKERVAGASGR